ncbi:MAG: type II secretion system F family protein [Thermoplasmatota archaeon]
MERPPVPPVPPMTPSEPTSPVPPEGRPSTGQQVAAAASGLAVAIGAAVAVLDASPLLLSLAWAAAAALAWGRPMLGPGPWSLGLLLVSFVAVLTGIAARLGVEAPGTLPLPILFTIALLGLIVWSTLLLAPGRAGPPHAANHAARLIGAGVALLGAPLAWLGRATAVDVALLGLLGLSIAAAAGFDLRPNPDAASRRKEEGRQPARWGVAAALVVVLGLLGAAVLFGLDLSQYLEQARDRPALLLPPVAILVVLAAGIAVAWRELRQQDEEILRPLQTPRERREAIIMGIAVAGGLLIAALAAAIHQGWVTILPAYRWVDVLGVAVLVAIGPPGALVAARARRIQAMEESFPDLLRDLAGSHEGGLTLPQAVAVAARGDYGPLSEEIGHMAEQLDWNVRFREAFARFGDRVNTSLVRRSVHLVLEAERTGGNTVQVLLAAARDARDVKSMERERRLSLGVYTLILHTTFLVFLGVVAVLYARFVPQMLASYEATQSANAARTLFSSAGVTLHDYRAFYFLAAIMQAIGGGLIAGLMATGRAAQGLQHSFWMVAAAVATFGLFI